MKSFSIVINTFNRAEHLKNAIRGALQLDYPEVEIVVVNGPSTDGTDAVLSRYRDRIKIADCPIANLSASRNAGIAQASGEIIAFMDDDAVPAPNWLLELARPYDDPRVGAVGGFTLDNTGRRLQAAKTLCDRFGNAFAIPSFADERRFNFRNSAFYPSLLGTNSSFRTDVLKEIGGFDETFAYLLDETDACLRIVDAGFHVVYAPEAFVFHQFAESHIRDRARVAKTLYPSAVSKGYFIERHGACASQSKAADEVRRYETELHASNRWFYEHGVIAPAHWVSLDLDLSAGLAAGRAKAIERNGQPRGHLEAPLHPEPFHPAQTGDGLRIALVSQGYPPTNETGIPRWTLLMATGLSKQDCKVHVLTRDDASPSLTFEDGIWLHRIAVRRDDRQAELLAARYDIPHNEALWMAAVREEVLSHPGFAFDVVSSPIWDLEGLGLFDLFGDRAVTSLHTTYALAQPYKPEWSARPLFEHFHVKPMIRQESATFERARCLLANSHAVVNDIEASYGISIRDKAVVVPHGTPDPLASRQRTYLGEGRDVPVIGFVGRFESRKGYDIAFDAFNRLLQDREQLQVRIVGDDVSKIVQSDEAAAQLLRDARVSFVGAVDRDNLDDILCDCDIVLIPSRYESFGLVAIEAMAAGAVVVAMAVGGLREVVTSGETGFLVEPNDEPGQEFARVVNGLLDDRRTLRRTSERGRKAFKDHYTVDAMARAAKAFYASIAEKARHGNL
jgi:glycosyltransferase involved in cell wall biosynthesis/GT2 family glycosyltransferase